MKIQVTVREVYGNRTIYPVCRTAQTLADLAGTKTLTPYALALIKKLGYEVETVYPQVIGGVPQ